MKRNIILTGFQPFGAYRENLSKDIALQLEEVSGHEVWGSVFPVDIFKKNGEIHDYGELIVKMAMNYNSKAIISLGIISSVTGIRVETRAVNWVENFKYCQDHEQRRVISSEFSPYESLKIDLEKWNLENLEQRFDLAKKFRAQNSGCEINFSGDAGNFCCNALMFRTLLALQKYQCDIPFLFAHVPSIRKPDSITRITKSLEIILSQLG